MFVLGNETLQDTSAFKLLGNPKLVAGYLAGGTYKNLSLAQAKCLVQKRMNDLYLGIQTIKGCEEVELTFRDEESYNWWNNLVNSITVVSVKNGYSIRIPSLPPKFIFEEI